MGLNVAGDEFVRAVNGNTRSPQREIVQLDVYDLGNVQQKTTT